LVITDTLILLLCLFENAIQNYILKFWVALERNELNKEIRKMKRRVLDLALIMVVFLSVMVAISTKTIDTTEITAKAEVWNGSTSTYFSAGSGSELDPYLIGSAGELALLAQIINGGTDAVVIDGGASIAYATLQTAYYQLTADITLNDETFTFDADTGLVIMTDGTNTAYIGTGIIGDTSGSNTTFDTTASVTGTIYTNMTGVTGLYSGAVNFWTAIGNGTNKFNGNFNGAGYEVSGIYINSTLNNQGLFGVNDTLCEIKEIELRDSYVKGEYNASGIIGYNAGTIDNCSSTAIVWGKFLFSSHCGI
jgi:hypothetical protein